MQLYKDEKIQNEVVFTLQTAGRCNSYDEEVALKMLFLPCKQQADATDTNDTIINRLLFLPCKQQADATWFENQI